MVLTSALYLSLQEIFFRSSQWSMWEGRFSKFECKMWLITVWLPRSHMRCHFTTLNFILFKIIKSGKKLKLALFRHKKTCKIQRDIWPEEDDSSCVLKVIRLFFPVTEYKIKTCPKIKLLWNLIEYLWIVVDQDLNYGLKIVLEVRTQKQTE